MRLPVPTTLRSMGACGLVDCQRTIVPCAATVAPMARGAALATAPAPARTAVGSMVCGVCPSDSLPLPLNQPLVWPVLLLPPLNQHLPPLVACFMSQHVRWLLLWPQAAMDWPLMLLYCFGCCGFWSTNNRRWIHRPAHMGNFMGTQVKTVPATSNKTTTATGLSVLVITLPLQVAVLSLSVTMNRGDQANQVLMEMMNEMQMADTIT